VIKVPGYTLLKNIISLVYLKIKAVEPALKDDVIPKGVAQ